MSVPDDRPPGLAAASLPAAATRLAGRRGAGAVWWPRASASSGPTWTTPASRGWAASLTLGLLGIGFALAYWGRDLTDDTPQAEPYPLPPADPQPREELAEAIHEDAQVLTRRRFLTAAADRRGRRVRREPALPVGLRWGPGPGRARFHTKWRAGSRLVTFDGRLIRPQRPGRRRLHRGLPRRPYGRRRLAGRAAAPGPEAVQAAARAARPGAPTASSPTRGVCTHAGCPVAQYEDQAQMLLCPCHQSSFNVLDGAKPTGGPAGRPLPQLPWPSTAQGVPGGAA